MKALLLESVHHEAATALRAAGMEVTTAKGALDELRRLSQLTT